jgi:ABC-type bacteriocin/lantibiotic exporter with double-glycine peptidase domain
MVLAFFGKVSAILSTSGVLVFREGTTALSLLNAGRHYGLRGRGVKVEIEDLKYLAPGCVLHWDFSHFVVLERVSGQGVHIVDPAYGRRSVTMNELRRSFTGAALVLEPGETFELAAAQRKSAWRYVQEVLRGSALWVRISVLSVLLHALLALPS